MTTLIEELIMKKSFLSTMLVLASVLVGVNGVSAMNIVVNIGNAESGNGSRNIEVKIGDRVFSSNTAELAEALRAEDLAGRQQLRINKDIELVPYAFFLNENGAVTLTDMWLKCGKIDILISHALDEFYKKHCYGIIASLNSDANDNVTINAASNSLSIRKDKEEAGCTKAKSIDIYAKDISLKGKIECNEVKAFGDKLSIRVKESDVGSLVFNANVVNINAYESPFKIGSMEGNLPGNNSETAGNTNTKCVLGGLLNVCNLKLNGFGHTIIGNSEMTNEYIEDYAKYQPNGEIIYKAESKDIEINNNDYAPLENLIKTHLQQNS